MIDTYIPRILVCIYDGPAGTVYVQKIYHHLARKSDLPERIKRSKKLVTYYSLILMPMLRFQDICNMHLLNNYSVALIPNGIQLKRYPYKTRNSPAPRLLWVRAFSEIYNPLMAVDVIAERIKDYPEASLCMIGPDRWQRQRIHNLCVE